VLIKSGAWSDKAETEVAEKRQDKRQRERQGKMACVCKCFTTAVGGCFIVYIVPMYRVAASQGRDGKEDGKEGKKSKKDQKKLLRRRLPSRSVDRW
jgi:hypothetical protein